MIPHTPIFPLLQTQKEKKKKKPYVKCVKKLLLKEKQKGILEKGHWKALLLTLLEEEKKEGHLKVLLLEE